MPKQYIDYMSSVNNDTGSLEKRYYRDQEARDAIQQGLATKLNSSVVGQPNGVASLDSNGVVPSSQLPSFVDAIEEYETIESFPEEGEASTIYVDLDTNIKYRWSGTQYVEISASLALGETSSTAYRGDRGAEAYQHAADPNKTSTIAPSGLYKIAVTDQGHVASVSDVTKSDITNLGIPAQDTTYQEATTSSAGLMSALDKTSLKGIAAVDQAVKSCSTFASTSEVINKMISDCRSFNNGDMFLRDFCNIILDNADTGAITGWDAGTSSVKTGESIVAENGSIKTFSGSSFIVNGLTINIPAPNNQTQQNIINGLYTWWAKNSLDLIEQSYGSDYRFDNPNASVNQMNVEFVNDNSSALALVRSKYNISTDIHRRPPPCSSRRHRPARRTGPSRASLWTPSARTRPSPAAT